MPFMRNIPFFRTSSDWNKETGSRLADTLTDIKKALQNISGQTNSNLQGAQAAPPPQINALSVEGGAGIYHAYITDNNQNLYRGAEYTLEYSEREDFQTFHVEHMGPSRDKRLNIGLPGPLHFRAYSGYGPASPPSKPVYVGAGVSAPGSTPPPLRGSNGSGTNPSTQGAGGYGNLPFRGNIPPRRG